MKELFAAWSLWLSGKLNDSFILWGIKLVWWGRIGKFLQAFAILTVIVELIGAERLTAFGNRLHGAFSLQKARHLISDANKYTGLWHRYMLAKSGSKEEKDLLAEQRLLASDNINLFLVVAFIGILGYILWGWMTWWLYLLVMFLALGVYAWVAAYITLVIVLLLSFIGLLFDTLVIEPIAWVISRPRLEGLIKVAALIAAIMGIHFDFLAS
jgi:hypothetical protein